MENFLQPKTLARVRDVREQLTGLCERVELVPESNANSADITGIQKVRGAEWRRVLTSRRLPPAIL